jgi:peptidoglycan/LPS O-acetylase OafA/YrhL
VLIATAKVGHNQTHFWILEIFLGFLSVGLSDLTYRFVENPIRHSGLSARASVIAGLATVAITLIALSVILAVTRQPLL